MASEANRPFIDRRLGFNILFEDVPDRMTGVNAEDVAVAAVNETSVSNSVGVSDAKVSKYPPQAKVVLTESHLTPEAISEIASQLEYMMGADVGDVQTVEVVSLALSPGNKVRNAMGI